MHEKESTSGLVSGSEQSDYENEKTSKSENEKTLKSIELPAELLEADVFDMDAIRGVAEALLPLFLHRLSRLVGIRSVSAHLHMRENLIATARLILSFLEETANYARLVEPGEQCTHDGQAFPLPPIILAEFGDADPKKPTVLVYSNYDVLDAEQTDGEGWESDPFKMRYCEEDEKIYGRGVSANKGQIMMWLATVDVFHRAEVDLPINLKLMIEGMGESNSECLGEVIQRELSPPATGGFSREPGFLGDVDYVIISTGEWADDSAAALVYGLRGLLVADLEIEGGSKTLSTGRHAGVVHEPVNDLVRLLGSMSSLEDEFTVPGLGSSSVPPVSKDELDDVRDLAIGLDRIKVAAGNLSRLTGDDREAVMMNRCHFPALSIHGVESSVTPCLDSLNSGPRRTIPKSAVAKFSVSLAQGQNFDTALPLLRDFLEETFSSFESANKLTFVGIGCDPWLVDPANHLYSCGAVALSEVFGRLGYPTNYIRDGCRSVAAVEMSKQLIEVPTMVLPFGRPQDNQHSENENISQEHFLNAISSIAVLFDELGRLSSARKMVPRASQKRRLLGRITTLTRRFRPKP